MFRGVEGGADFAHGGNEVDAVGRKFVRHDENGIDAGFNIIGLDVSA